jgi:hypothetical protein
MTRQSRNEFDKRVCRLNEDFGLLVLLRRLRQVVPAVRTHLGKMIRQDAKSTAAKRTAPFFAFKRPLVVGVKGARFRKGDSRIPFLGTRMIG